MGKKRNKLKDNLGNFLRQYGRKHAAHDPNDRRYSRELEDQIKRLRPEELDRLMRGEDEPDPEEPQTNS